MKLKRCIKSRGLPAGYLLIEALVYISVVVALLGVGYVALYKSMKQSVALRRGAEDVSRAMHACERWRQDVRNASVIRPGSQNSNEVLMEGQARTNSYLFSGTNILRRTGSGPWTVLLPDVKASEMEPCRLGEAQGWRWNFEVKSRTGSSRIRPLFTSTAVPRPINAGPQSSQ
jgi:hypothetical protein